MTEKTEFTFSTEGLEDKLSSRPWRGETRFVRTMAHLFSYVFHPLFITLYVVAFLLFVHPLAFAGLDEQKRFFRLLIVAFTGTFLPAFSVFLLWRLEFTSSIFLRTQKERIIPYAIAMICYFWIWYVFRNIPDSPAIMRQFLLGAFLGVCGAWLANIAFKISMHGTAVGGMLAFMLLQGWRDPAIGGSYISLALVITGLVCTARLIVGQHSQREVYGGLFIGIAAQALALYLA